MYMFYFVPHFQYKAYEMKDYTVTVYLEGLHMFHLFLPIFFYFDIN